MAMTSGRDTLASIERAIDDLQRREADARRRLEEANDARSDLAQARLGSLRNLAEVRMQSALADDVIEEADHLSFQVETLLKARQKTIDDLKSKRDASEEDWRQAAEADSELTGHIAELEQQLDDLAEEARAALANDADFKKQSRVVAKLQETVERAAQKTEQALADRKSKGVPYETDPIFMYLWKRKYGARSYDAHPVIRWLDEKCARLIGYHDARANYAVLLEIPERLGEHVAGLGEKLRAEEGRAEALLSAKMTELAGGDLVEELKAERRAKQDNTAKLAELATSLSEIDVQLKRYAEGGDELYRRALETSAEFLGDEELRDLKALARRTETPSDDQVVARIATIDRDVTKLERETKSLRGELDKLFEKKEDLLRLATEFRRADYDDPASEFQPDDFGKQLLEELLRGVITGADYWMRARRGQRWRSRPADPFRRQEGLPPFNGTIFGGRGGRSGKASSRGGFRTGGGF